MTGFIGLFATAPDYTLHLTVRTADVPVPLRSGTASDVSYKLLVATAHDD
jgi:hypothetical protein